MASPLCVSRMLFGEEPMDASPLVLPVPNVDFPCYPLGPDLDLPDEPREDQLCFLPEANPQTFPQEVKLEIGGRG